MPSPSQHAGKRGENIAAAYLESKGFRILEENYRFHKAEVDLICFLPAEKYEEGGELVFVEVKARSNTAFGHPEDAVDRSKQKNLIRAARAFLYERRLEGSTCRFDVIAISDSESNPVIEHIENAFMMF